MKRCLVLLMTLTLICAVGAMVTVYAGPGPAPNAADGNPDGSGFDVPPGTVGDGDEVGPAPNSGDGTPDGSGF